MVVPRLWVSIKITSQVTGKSEKALFEQIRTGIFPFEYRRAGRSILVSARDLGLLDLPVEPPNSEAQGDQVDSLPAAA
jgi:hypothetical protein